MQKTDENEVLHYLDCLIYTVIICYSSTHNPAYVYVIVCTFETVETDSDIVS